VVRTHFDVARARGQAAKKNRKETRGERDRLAENGGSPHPAKEEPPPFLARRLPFCPGRGLICPTGNPPSSEPTENRAFSERILLFFSICSLGVLCELCGEIFFVLKIIP